MGETAAFLGQVLVGSLNMAVFAALLIGYVWDFLRLRKSVILGGAILYCVLATVLDLLTAQRLGYGPEEQLLYILLIGVVPYCSFYFLTRIPLCQYLYCLGSVSIQAFFIDAMLESLQITPSSLVLSPILPALGYIAGVAVLDVIVIIVFRRFGAPLFREVSGDATWRKLMLSPLSGGIALGVFYYATNFQTCGTTISVIFCLCYVALFISDIAALNSLGVSMRAARAEATLESANRILETQKEQYKRLSDAIAQTRQARHDLRHHINAAAAFLAADDKEGLRAYLAEYGQTPAVSEETLYTGNHTADIIVGHYLSLARQSGIHVDYSLQLPQALSIRDTDLCVLMGNCLENAIDACMKLPEAQRFLRVESAVKNRFLAITVANSYDGSAVMQDGVYLSSKRQQKSAGIGLASVETVVRAYHGEMKIKSAGNVFTVYVMLKMLDKQ